MAEISAAVVKDLREKTGAGMMECKKALAEVGGDFEKAVEYLRKKGLADASKRSGRATAEGLIGNYVHPGGKIAVLVEVNCETDFVARNEQFQELVRNLAMHIAAASPMWVRREDVPASVVAKEKEVVAAQVKEENKAKPKPDNVVEKIVEGKMGKFFQQVCLLEQAYVKEPDLSIEAYLKSQIATIKENISIRRFARFQLGEQLPGAGERFAGELEEDALVLGVRHVLAFASRFPRGGYVKRAAVSRGPFDHAAGAAGFSPGMLSPSWKRTKRRMVMFSLMLEIVALRYASMEESGSFT